MNENLKSYSIDKIPYKRIYGRTSSKERLALFWAASGIEIRVKASEVWALIESDYDTYETWLSIKVNGFRLARQSLVRGKQWVRLVQGMGSEKENTILLQRDTQPMTGDANNILILHEIALPKEAIFCPVEKKDLTIEFIGDSITSGEGLYGSPYEMDYTPQNFGGTKTYAVMASEKLNACYSIVSQCGYGISFGWNGDTAMTLPCHYDFVCSLMNSKRHEKIGSLTPFSFTPPSDIVVINLGTNDNGGSKVTSYKGDVKEKIVGDTYNFLKKIRDKNPGAHIIWTWGMMALDFAPALIQKGIDLYKSESKDPKVHTLIFDPMDLLEKTDEDKGSRGHPGVKTHKAAAEKLVSFIRSSFQS